MTLWQEMARRYGKNHQALREAIAEILHDCRFDDGRAFADCPEPARSAWFRRADRVLSLSGVKASPARQIPNRLGSTPGADVRSFHEGVATRV